MAQNVQTKGTKIAATSNLYTTIIGLAFFVVLATAAFVACKCYFNYGTFFSVP